MKVYCKFCSFDYHSPTTDLECPSCGNTDTDDFIFDNDDPITTTNELLRTWVEIGRKNYWIARSYDPPFDEKSFYHCGNVEELISKLAQGNWCVGQGFYHKNLCFINQINGGDEWLIIRDDIAFESYSCGRVINRDVDDFIDDLEKYYTATDEQLRTLDF